MSVKRGDMQYTSSYGGKTTQIGAFLAQPEGEEKRGAVLVIQEIFGLTEHIKDIATRFAKAGYIALAPDLFTREGAPPSAEGGFEKIRAFASAIPDAQIMADLDAAGDYLLSQQNANGKLGIVGYCWGGRIAMLYNAKALSLDAAVAYYGRVKGEATANQPEQPIDVAEAMQAPLQGHFGGKDESIPLADVSALQEKLGGKANLFVYPQAGHAFNNDTRPQIYHEAAAKLAWQRTLDWFKTTL